MILFFATIILSYLGRLENPKTFFVFLFFSGLTALTAILMTVFAWNRINRALEKPSEMQRNIPPHVPETFPETLETGEFDALPPHTSPASVTEGTTNLLSEEWTKKREKEKVPISNRRETNDLN